MKTTCGISNGTSACRRMRFKQRRDDKGVTLIELMTVLGLLSVLGGAAGLFVVNWLPKYRLKSAAFDLFSSFQTARMQAIKTGYRNAIFFDTDASAYQIVGAGQDGLFQDAGGAGDDRYGRIIDLSDYGDDIAFGHGNASRNATTAASNRFPGDGVSYAGNAAEFNSRGMSNKMGYVYIANNAGDVYAISTPTMAGVVIMKRWNGGEWL